MTRLGDCSYFFTKYLRNRELGIKVKTGTNDKFMKKLYSNLVPCSVWDHSSGLRNSAPGGIFNLEFSPDGSLLVAACEKRSILLFDPICRQLVNSVDDAHFDCVNCVRFLDSRVFATCSDDSTVALWDTRNLKSRIRTLHGHSNWVKNIEYSQTDGLLVTSGFDGVIYTWDINSYTENGFLYDRVFHTTGLMRTRLNPDASKMIICTTGGFLILIHDLNLRTLAKDLNGFKPNMYRLMQLSQTTIPVAARFTHLFSKRRKQNRIEFVSDFPEGDDAEVVSSLQVHPQGWCALSRNISNDESSEWTCVHDIQDIASSKDDNLSEESSDSEGESSIPLASSPSPPSHTPLIHRGRSHRESLARAVRGLRRQNAFRGLRSTSSAHAEITLTSSDVWEAVVAIREARARRQGRQNNQGRRDIESSLRIVRMQSGYNTISQQRNLVENNLIPEGDRRGLRGEMNENMIVEENNSLSSTSSSSSSSSPLVGGGGSGDNPSPSATLAPAVYVINRPGERPRVHKIKRNLPRLTHYIEENNVGKGFIKELCFSADGRLICSPFGYGVRLLTFSPRCCELSSCIPQNGPVKLHELGTNVSHQDIVVSTKFSPTHCLLVSGCLTGRIVWHQPLF